MHYEINVTLNGAHHFATHERSATDEKKAARLFQDLRQRFPEAQGYQVTASMQHTTGRNVTDQLSRLKV